VVPGQVVGGELGGERAPAERQPGADHRELGEGAPERVQRVGQHARQRHPHQHQRDREVTRRLRAAARRRAQRRAGHAEHDRQRRQVLVAPGVLAEHALPQDQQHQQPAGERGLHHQQRRQQQRQHLQRPAQHRQAGAEQPASPPHQATDQRRAQVLLVRRLARVHRLQRDP